MQKRNQYGIILVGFLSIFVTSFTVTAASYVAGKIPLLTNLNPDDSYLQGEFIDKRTGSMYWEIRDIHLPGNGGLDMSVYRSYGKIYDGYESLSMGYWDFEVPRIVITANMSGEVQGSDPSSLGICANPVPKNTATIWSGATFFTGLKLVIPGQPVRTLMKAKPNSTFGGAYITEDDWVVNCHTIGGRMDGFVVISPDGKKYILETVARLGGVSNPDVKLTLPGVIVVYASYVEDVHGNSIDYTYTTSVFPGGNYYTVPRRVILTSIQANDGRRITLSGDKITVESADAPKQTWRYEVEANRLSENYRQLQYVHLPEGLKWSYEYSPSLINAGYYVDANGDGTPENWIHHGFIKKVTLPQGAEVNYKYYGERNTEVAGQYKRAHDWGGPADLIAANNWPPQTWASIENPKVYPLFSRKMTGPGIPSGLEDGHPTYTRYEYQRPDQSVYLGTNVTRVSRNDLSRVEEYTYHLDYSSWLHGRLLSAKIYSTFSPYSDPIREETYQWEKVFGKSIAEYPSGITHMPEHLKYKVGMKERNVDNTFITTVLERTIYGAPAKIKEVGIDDYGWAAERGREITYFRNLNAKNRGFRFINVPEDEFIGAISLSQSTGLATITPTWKIDRQYSGDGKLMSINEFGIKENYSYYADGNLHKRNWVRNGVNYQVIYSNYKRGIAQSEQWPGGVTTSRVVNDYGLITSETNGRGYKTAYDYDALNRIKKITPPTGNATNVLWVNANQSRTTRGSYQITADYDGLGREILTTEKDLAINGDTIYVKKKYYPTNLLAFKSFPSSSLHDADTYGVTYTYDVLARIASEKINSPDNDTLYRSFKHNLTNTLISDGRNNKKSVYYSGYGDPANVWVRGEGSNTSMSLSYSRNLLGDLVKISQDRKSETYTYKITASGDQTRLIETIKRPETGTTVYTYDEVGNRKSRKTGSLPITNYTYDALNRLDYIDYPTGTTDVDYIYDNNSNIKTIITGNIRRDYAYNAVDQLTTEILKVDNTAYNLTYGYNAQGALDSIGYPTNRIVSLAPDAFGRATQLSGYVNKVAYHPNGLPNVVTFANGVQQQIALKTRMLPDTLKATKGGATIMSLTYDYDKENNIVSILDRNNSLNDKILAYDADQRLISATSPVWSGAGAITYDKGGNIKTKNINGESFTYNYASDNRLANITGSSYNFGYDGYGNVISNGHDTFVYDNASNLTDVTGTHPIKYQYDGHNYRVRTIKNGEQTISFYNKAGLLMYSKNVTTGDIAEHIYLNGQRVASTKTCQSDTDGDGIPDCVETYNGLNPNDSSDGRSDADGDGLSNAAEYQNNLAMHNPDTDGDGMSDGFEVKYDLLNADPNGDADGDGLTNVQEARLKTNPRNQDTDNDGVRDDVDPNPNFNPALIPIITNLLLG